MKAKNQLPKLGATSEGFKQPERAPQNFTPQARVKPRKKQKGKKR